MPRLAQCIRCGKGVDLEKEVTFTNDDGSPMTADKRPQPWLTVQLSSAQPSYLTPLGSAWPRQEMSVCDDCNPIVVDALAKAISGAAAVNEPLVEYVDLSDVIAVATTEPPLPPEPVVTPDLGIIDAEVVEP